MFCTVSVHCLVNIVSQLSQKLELFTLNGVTFRADQQLLIRLPPGGDPEGVHVKGGVELAQVPGPRS